MKKKLVMKVQMNCEKCRIEARKVAAVASGVESVAIEGKEKEMVVVLGESLDPACLVAQMRKKVGHTELVSFEEVKPKPNVPNPKPLPPNPQPYPSNPQPYCHPYPVKMLSYEVVYDQDPPPCSIM